MDGTTLPPIRIAHGALCNDDSPASDWHPRIARFFRYWHSLRPQAGVLPGRQHLDPLAIPELLPGIWLLDIQREPFRLRYRLVGTENVEAIGGEVTGMWLDEAHPVIARDPDYLNRYRDVIERKIPSYRRGTPQLWTQHNKYQTLENLITPLAADGQTVDMLASITVFHPLPMA